MTAARDREQAAVRAFLASDGPDTLLVVGRRGSGRSWSLRRIHEEDRPGTVLAAIRPSERHLPLAGLTAVIASLQEPLLAEFVGRFRLTDTSETGIIGAASDVLAVLRSFTMAPRILLVDDLDRADPESRIALSFMASRLAGTGLRMIATVGRDAAAGRFSGFEHVVLAESSPEDLVAIAALSDEADESTVRLVIDQTEAVPGAVLRQLASLSAEQRQGLSGVGLPLIAAYPKEAEATVGRLGREELAILARVASAPLVTRRIAVGTSLDAEHLAGLIAKGLLVGHRGALTVTDPSVRSFVYWTASPDERLRLHSEIGALEEELCPPLATWHRSHLASAPAPGGEWADELFHAARDLLALGHRRAAMETAERALVLLSPASRSAQLDFADALVRSGEVVRARRHVLDRAGSQHGRSILRAASLDLLLRAIENDDVAPEEADALAARWAVEFPDEAADLLSSVVVWNLGQDDLDSARRRDERIETLGASSPPASSRHWIARQVSAATDVVRRSGTDALGPTGPGARMGFHLFRGRALSAEEDYEAARSDFAAISGAVEGLDPRSPWRRAAVVASVENDIRAGEVARALARGTRLAAWDPPRAREPRELLLDSWRAQMQGHVAESEAILADLRASRTARNSASLTARTDARAGTLALMTGDVDRAVDRLRLAARSTNAGNAAWLRVAVKLVEALTATGDRDAAIFETDVLRAQHAAYPTRWTGTALLRCRVLTGDPNEAEAAFLEVTAAPGSSPFDIARTRTAWGERLLSLGERAGGQAVRAQADDELAAMGAVGWLRSPSSPSAGTDPVVAVLTAVEGGSGVDPDGRRGRRSPLEPLGAFDVLDVQQREVLALMRRGYRNKEIARELYVSLRTVEGRISQIYDAMGTRSRARLLAMASTAGSPDRERLG